MLSGLMNKMNICSICSDNGWIPQGKRAVLKLVAHSLTWEHKQKGGAGEKREGLVDSTPGLLMNTGNLSLL